MTHIIKGANIPVPAGLLRVAVCRRNVPGTPSVDASALLLDAVGRVRGDADLVFFNQPAHPSGAVRHAGNGEGGGQLAEWLELDLPRIEPAVQRVLIAGSCDGGVFGAVPGLAVQALAGDGAVVAHYEVTDASSETAFVLGEFYRRNGEWKFRAVGQGYSSGLAGLATDFGIAVAGTGTGTAGPVPTAPLPTAPLPTAPPSTGHVPAAPIPTRPLPTATPVSKAAGTPAPPVTLVWDTAPAAPDPFSSLTPDFQPFVRSGRGNDVLTVDVPIPPGPVIVEVWKDGTGWLAAHTLTRRNKDDELLVNTTVTDFRGRVLTMHQGDRPLRLRIQTDHAWTVAVRPLSVIRRLGTGLQGFGPEVLGYTGPAADLLVEYAGKEGLGDGDGNLTLWIIETESEDLSDRDLLLNKIGRRRETVALPDGPLLMLFHADGPWQLTARPLPSFD
ncbi:TerD family protein [Streptomyces sp. NPDC058256]|uniref:TerD family protein n=1 Tax=Streptomyces sp. NPDC058256 TaxID=3346408 RepID=UPI0036E8D192